MELNTKAVSGIVRAGQTSQSGPYLKKAERDEFRLWIPRAFRARDSRQISMWSSPSGLSLNDDLRIYNKSVIAYALTIGF